MTPISRFALILLCLVATRAQAAEQSPAPATLATLATGPTIPVLAWGGISWGADATPERYRELADCGFSHNFANVPNPDAMRQALDLAQAAGIKQLVSIGELRSDPEATAKRFKDHPAHGGYYLRDEPGADLFAELGAWAKRIQSVDPTHPCYVNLFPTYGDPTQWKAPTYQEYVDRFLAEVPTPMLSFDHYPVIREGPDAASDRLRNDYYHNLEICSAAARKSGRPMWAFALATAHNPYPIPTVAHLRVQVFSDLAYGAQAIQYFTYWTSKSEVWNFHQGPIEVDGKRTPTYDRVKQVNRELQALRRAFLGSRVIWVGHTGAAIPHGTTRFYPAAPVRSIETPGGGAVVSRLDNGDARYLVVVNRDLHKPMSLRLEFDPTADVKFAAKDGKLSPISANGAYAADVEPGDVAVFSWQAE